MLWRKIADAVPSLLLASGSFEKLQHTHDKTKIIIKKPLQGPLCRYYNSTRKNFGDSCHQESPASEQVRDLVSQETVRVL
jgi:hypothetical protein